MDFKALRQGLTHLKDKEDDDCLQTTGSRAKNYTIYFALREYTAFLTAKVLNKSSFILLHPLQSKLLILLLEIYS